MNQHRDEGDLERLNRLLERLHQAGYAQHGSHIEIVWVSPGAQHVNHQYIASPLTPLQGERGTLRGRGVDNPEASKSLPEVLATEEAMVLWQKVQRAGYVDEDYQPLLSRTQAALLADAMAERLGIKEKWKVFEGLWNRKNMRGDYTRAMNQRQSLSFQDKLKRLFSTDIEENTGKT